MYTKLLHIVGLSVLFTFPYLSSTVESQKGLLLYVGLEDFEQLFEISINIECVLGHCE